MKLYKIRLQTQKVIMKSSSVYKNKNFIIMYISTIFSNLGHQLYIFVLPILIYTLTQSAFSMSIMRALDFLPNILFGMLLGTIIDRVNRNKVLKYASFIKVMLLLVITLIIVFGSIQIWQLYLVGFLFSTASYTFGNAQYTITPQLFEKNKMTDIQAKFSLVNTLVAVIGPSIAGILIVWFEIESLFILYTICLFIVWIMCHFLDSTPTPKKSTENSIVSDMKEGIIELFGNKELLHPTIGIVFINFSTSLIIGVLVFYTVDTLGEPIEKIGLMYSISAIGGFIGAKVIKYLRFKWARGKIFISMLAIDCVCLILFYLATSWWQLGILLAIRTFTAVTMGIIYGAIRQESTPNHLLGRVGGTSSMLMKIVLPIGLFISGIWAEYLPIKFLFLFSALVIFMVFINLLKGEFRDFE